jgi:uncharacterized membrane protein YfcA
MTFITLAMMTALCLFIPVAMPFAALGAVITLYFYPYQTLALLSALLVVMGAYFYFNHRRKRRAY